MYPFIAKLDGKPYIKLHRTLYRENLLREIESQEPGFIKSIKLRKEYYFLELDINEQKDYLDFLDYLTYLERNS